MTTWRPRLAGAYAALSVADTVLVGLGPRARRVHYAVKPLLMPALAARLVRDSDGGPVIRQVLAAQGLSWGGDVALMGTSERQFLAGVGSFLGAHLAYVAAFRALGSGSPIATTGGRAVLALSSVLVPANAVLAGRRDARFRVPVGVYGLALTAMAAGAGVLPDSPGRRRIQAGAALFLLSDSMIGAQKFLRDEPHRALGSAVMATYTAGQWLISDGVRRAVLSQPTCESAEDGNDRVTRVVGDCAQINTLGVPVSMFSRRNATLVEPDQTLPGRTERPFFVADKHKILDAPVITDEAPAGLEVAIFGLGCFWGAEEIYWQVPGVWSTSAGYAGGTTPNPSYEEVCSGRTNHTEAIRVVFDPTVVSFADLVRTFFEVHDPTQGFRQGNDVGTQYRSAIYYTTPEQEQVARELTDVYGAELERRRLGSITTEIRPASETPYYYAEDQHQQYLAKNPFGYRCHANTGVKFPATA